MNPEQFEEIVERLNEQPKHKGLDRKDYTKLRPYSYENLKLLIRNNEWHTMRGLWKTKGGLVIEHEYVTSRRGEVNSRERIEYTTNQITAIPKGEFYRNNAPTSEINIKFMLDTKDYAPWYHDDIHRAAAKHSKDIILIPDIETMIGCEPTETHDLIVTFFRENQIRTEELELLRYKKEGGLLKQVNYRY